MQARIAAAEFLLFIHLRVSYMLAFLCRIPLKSFISDSLYDLTPLFAESHNPCFIRIIATPQTTIFQNDMPNVVLESPSNVFRAACHL